MARQAVPKTVGAETLLRVRLSHLPLLIILRRRRLNGHGSGVLSRRERSRVSSSLTASFFFSEPVAQGIKSATVRRLRPRVRIAPGSSSSNFFRDRLTGRTPDFDSGDEGSNPSPGACKREAPVAERKRHGFPKPDEREFESRPELFSFPGVAQRHEALALEARG